MSGGTVNGNVYGGGKGEADEFTCAKAMVGVVDDGVTETTENGKTIYTLKDGGTSVSISNGRVKGNVYGGGEVGRVEKNTEVEIGSATGTSEPIIEGNVFGAGAGLDTHGYSALVRGNSTVTIQGSAEIWKNVYGGGEKASVGRYKVKTPANEGDADVPESLPYGMPAVLKAGGTCTVNIQGSAKVGTLDDDDNLVEGTGNVFGAGKGVNPHEVTYAYEDDEHKPKRMIADNSWEYFVDETAFLQYIETLALSAATDVIIGGKRETTGESEGNITTSEGSPAIKGSVFGGSENGFVYHGTEVNIKKGTINGDVFGGGKGLATYAEAGRVRENTKVTMSDGTVKGNVYGGGSLGDVGRINKTLTGYNYKWTDDAVSNNDAANTTYAYNNTGLCEVEINGGTIGTDNDNTTGHVFGAGKGLADTFYCEKAMVYTTDVSVTTGTVKGNIYGGGQLGRVEDNTVVTIGTENETTGSKKPDIKGGVFGAGAGVATHGYSALVRGNSTVTVQGKAEIEKNVYGGGEIASVGRFRVENSLPKEPLSGGTCTVTIKGDAKVGTGSDGGSVYGACKGVEPDYTNSGSAGHVINTGASVEFDDEDDYLAFLQTLALTSNTNVTINGNASVNGSVFGGGRRGITLGDVTVNMTGGTVNQDVYGGGALANTNTGNWNDDYGSVAGITANTTDVKGYYTRTGAGTTESPYVYTKIETSTTAAENTTYYSKDSWAHATLKSEQYKTFVNILGGKVVNNVYGGGLGDASTPAYVWGDVKVNLNGLEKAYYDANSTTFSSILAKIDADATNSDYMVPSSSKGAIVGRIFGCNNLNGTPKGKVRVHVFATQNVNTNTIAKTDKYAHPVQGENDTENSKETSAQYLQRLINAAHVDGDKTKALLPGITETVITTAQATHDADNPAATEEQLNEAISNVQQELMKLYDVEAVYGGGNQAEYYPVDADSETEAVKNAARTEVVIDGCDYTSIKEVYAGGNAASTPATYVRVNAAYEINEVFGGGNGRDNLFVTENNTTVEYENPGANVGYHNYTEWGTAGTDGVIPAVEKDDAGTPEDRANSNYRYGSGIATTWVTGGRIHNVYGGSNEKGNVSTTAVSVYQEADDSCPLIIDETYGGGKNSQMDGTIDLSLNCVQNMKEIFGGAKNADVNDDIVLNITNGTFEKVFGGNNTSGAINGSITVNVKEEGCSPIEIDELYGGGYLAGYSIYGYYTDANNNKIPRTKLDFKAALISAIGNQLSDANKEAVAATLADARNIDEVVIQAALATNNITDSGNTIAGNLKTAFGTAGLLGFPKNDPRINVISATRIDNIFGGGYEAMVIGSPHVNVNMTEGAIEVKKVEKTSNDQIPNNEDYTTTESSGESTKTYVYKDVNGEFYKHADLTLVEGNIYTSPLALGQIGNIYGGGNMADIQGNTYVEIGTGQWVSTWDTNGNPVWGTEDAEGNKYIYNEQSTARNYTEQECIDYNALLDGAVAAGQVQTPAVAEVLYTAEDEEVINGTKQVGEVKTPAVEEVLYTPETANAYNATLDGAVTTNDIKPAVWAWYKVGVANDPGTTTTPTPARNDATITGNVFGGGKGLEDNFLCDKAMVGIAGAGVDENTYPNGYPDGNTNVTIANGTIAGSVYGGGEVGRVEMNTTVTIGIGDGVASGTPTSEPVITGSVFGGGKGVETHGYSALVRGNPTVVVQGNAKVRGNVYGGGQIASVARYNVAQSDAEGAPYGVKKDEPYALRTNSSGFCTVTVRGYAEIGPTSFDSNAKETLVGHVFGAGKGIVPGGEYAYRSGTTKRMVAIRDAQGKITGSEWETFTDPTGESDYITFIKTLALSSQTDVTIDGHATVKGSVFGGSESGFVQFDTNVTVKDGSIGTTGKGGADFGNVYGGGKGDAVHTGSSNNYVEAGLVKGNTKVKVEGGTILHNVYGGGAYGTVGEFTYDNGMPTSRRTYIIGTETHNTTGGNTEVYITGGEIGTNGDENGMVFGSSRGDVGDEYSIHNKLAWVYDTHVAIGDTTTTTTSTTTPLINGSIYGGGENGHNFRSSYVRINGGTIGMTTGGDITDDNGTPNVTTDDITYSGAAYPYRGNVYGGGCGTDKYDSDNDGVNDAYNPLAGIVYGDATVTMTGGQIVHNVYGAGAMGSVGKATTTNNVTTVTGGTTTITISNGKIGVNGTYGEGNVFGAARGSDDATGDDRALVRKSTSVSISGTTQGTQIKGNVYGGGELGCVGVFTETTDGRYVWTTGTGDSNVEITGGSITGSVFGAGKGKDDTFKCEKGMVKATNVSITAGAVGGDVYGGGEVGRVEYDTEVKIGDGEGTPAITHSVFGGGAGVETHGYSALVRGNTTVTVEGNAQIGEGVYGGGEIASVGRYGLDADKMPSILLSGGECKVTVQGYATIGTDVFGAGKGIDPHFDKDNTDKTKRSRRMTIYTNATDFPSNENGTTWEPVTAGATLTSGSTLIWQYFQTEPEYSKYLETLALATAPVVTIGGNAAINGSVFGGGEVGITKGNVVVNILSGTITKDVYGGGALANTNTTSLVGVLIDGVPKKDNEGNIETTTVHPTTKVNLLGGTIDGDVYGGGLGCLDFAGKKYTSEEATAYNTANNFSSTDDGYVTVNDYKERPVTAVKAFVYGDIKVNLNGLEADDYIEDIHKDYVQAVGSAQSPDYYELKTTQSGSGTEQDPTVINYPKGAIVNQIFGCNNLNGSPKKHVKVHVFATQSPVNGHNTLNSKYPQRPAQGKNETYAAYLTRLATTYSEVTAVTAKISAAQAANATLTEKTTAYNSAIDEEAQATALAELNAAQAAFDAEVAALNAEFLNLYDVKAVYGGGNLAAYEPIDPNPDTDWNDTEEYTEVIIDGCDLTSIETVYGGGNAASVPASYVRVNGTQEIEELFGGGNGKDNYSLDEGSSKVWYKNPGANVGYYNYTHYVKKNEAGYNATNDGAGTSASPYIVHDNTNASTVDDRKTYYKYGSGITTIEVTGGLIHATFGGSNTKGNIREKAESTYEDAEICPMRIDETYGGGKDSPMDAEIDMALDCVKDMDMIFGGSKNADVDNNITLNITNGTFQKVFGGNNTSGAINGAITVNIEERGCQPIEIEELYLGGYLAPYSVYGYKKTNGVYETIDVDGIPQRIPLKKIDSGASTTPYNDPRLNVISATRIGNIFGGGYKATVVGNPYVNVNMTTGTVKVTKTPVTKTTVAKKTVTKRAKQDTDNTEWIITEGGINYVYVYNNTTFYDPAKVEIDDSGESPVYSVYYTVAETVETVYNPAKVEKGTTNYIYKDAASYYDPTKVFQENTEFYVYKDGNNNSYENDAVTDEKSGTLELGTIGNIYGGGNMADIIGSTHVEIGTGRWVTAWENGYPVYETEYEETENNNKVIKHLYYKEKVHAEYYNTTTATTYNATLDGALSTAALTAEQAEAYNSAIHPEEDKKEGDQLTNDEVISYNAKLPGAVRVGDVQTPAEWAWYTNEDDTEPCSVTTAPTPTRNAAQITGNVFGGGKGVADNFYCNKAMVGIDGAGVDANNHPTGYRDGNTNVTIANGSVGGSVYGGGEIGRVEMNSTVTIGDGDGVASGTPTSAPVIEGSVFGGGKGKETHGYAALVRGNPTVVVQGNAKVRGNVYGGGEIASVARYKVKKVANDPDAPIGWPIGSPYALKDANSGFCKVTIRGYAEIGPDNMQMTADGAPDDAGHVFGAGMGILPKEYDYVSVSNYTGDTYNIDEHMPSRENISSWEWFSSEPAYIGFIQTLALASETDVTIGDHAFVKGSVYGGSFNGIVQYNTHVTIEGDCQIGNGHIQIKDNNGNITEERGVNRRYTDAEWAAGHLFVTDDPNTTEDETDPDIDATATEEATLRTLVGDLYSASLPECASWPYEPPYEPWNLYDYVNPNAPNPVPKAATDGHTFYGNVFGGGSGYYPYRRKNAAIDGSAWAFNQAQSDKLGRPVDANGYSDGVWLRSAGLVRGNTTVDIKGGHILTSVYGGNEQTDVEGNCTVNMSGGTLGVPRTLGQIAKHPVTCYLFGAGKGDQRINFNTWTNVKSVDVNITGGWIYGSVFGGGEDGHVLEDVTMTISGNNPTNPTYANYYAGTATKIGTWGTSYVDGNVFGGGRGFSGDAQTAGTVGGNINLAISGGEMLGSIYGGGRLASVGTQFTAPEDPNYGNFLEDNEDILYTQADCDAYNPTIPGYITAGKAFTAAQAVAYNAVTGESVPEGYTPSETEANNYNKQLPDYKEVGDTRIPKGNHGHITINISGGTIGNDYETITLAKADAENWTDADWTTWKATNHVPNTEFELSTDVYRASHTKGGNVFGGSMGRLELLNNTRNPIWPKMAQVKTTAVNIYGDAVIKRTVYGGGELGTVRDNAYVTIGGIKTADVDEDGIVGIEPKESTNCTVNWDVYGGGYGSLDGQKTVFTVKELKEGVTVPSSANDYIDNIYAFTPMQFSGSVGQNTFVHVKDGYIKKSVYGGGEMASVGIINFIVKEKTDQTSLEDDNIVFHDDVTDKDYYYMHFHKHDDKDNGFILSWPYHFENVPGYFGATHVHVTGGRIGASTKDDIGTDNGDVYGGGKGFAGDYKDYVFCANVGSTDVRIEYPATYDATPANYMNPINNTDNSSMFDCISGAVYGGGENGHVMGDTKVTLTNGLIGHSIYGGGSGKGQFKTWLTEIPAERRSIVTPGGSGTPPATRTNDQGQTEYEATCYSITAGKVFGNTEVEMTGGYVVRNIYGGGNLGSVGKGNYAGGPDDYSSAGYGEKLSGNLWDGVSPFSQAFLSSGKCTVKILGGTVGYIDETNPSNSMYPWNSTASLPYGNVFGGCRGESAPNILETPRYLYSPEFFVGYANETEVTIGKPATGTPGQEGYSAASGPTILGSVYGGGQDGHVRRDATVTVYGGEIGLPYTTENRQKVRTLPASPTTDQIKSTADLDDLQWLARGNVYGAGSGIGMYKYDFNYDGDFGDVVNYNNGKSTVATNEEDHSTSAGSVTRFTTVNINGGIIHRNVYGGGSLSTVGAPKIPPINYDPYRKGDTAENHSEGKQSLNQVNIAGTIGTPDGYGNDNTFKYNPVYGGEVYGASRGDVSLGSSFSNAVWTEVNLLPGARVQGNVFGGGDSGPVKQDSEVNVGVTFNIASTDIEDDAMNILQTGGDSNKKTINITSNITWEAKSSASWLTVSQKSGEGDGTITVTATENDNAVVVNNQSVIQPRTATITISAPGQTKTITVTQAGAGS